MSHQPPTARRSRRLLHISASPRGAQSESLALADHFLTSFTSVHPEIEVEHWDLWDGTLPEFGPAAAAAKMSVFAGADPHGEAARAWADAIATFRRFDSADRYLFSVPMWNAGVPYILKQFIDVISQPGLLFGFDPVEGYSGLLQHKKAAVIYTGAVYGAGRGPRFGSDFQTPYVQDWLRWAGIADIEDVRFQPNLATTDAEGAREIARGQVWDLGKRF